MAQHYSCRQNRCAAAALMGGNESAASNAHGVFCSGEKCWGDCGACERMGGVESRMIPIGFGSVLSMSSGLQEWSGGGGTRSVVTNKAEVSMGEKGSRPGVVLLSLLLA
ncbi:Os11g0172750 [Oryza sativa Japonica Group]|uniref:Os11g0172750 protein n=1 Tax=Oryza sativa subsp. japonica TaxID=39947 RepID=A0A0P0XZ79_ORYSJ|nr:Os11g0172750 [Oryza sativa Japonica Group]